MRKDKFVDNVGRLLHVLGFKAYWPNNPIDINELKTTFTRPKEIEIDIVSKLERVGFLIEVTTKKEGNKEKINKFLHKLRVIQQSKLNSIEIAQKFSGIPKNEIEEFRDIKAWKGIYIGTSPEIIYRNYKPEDFGAKNELRIINIDDWIYISRLVKCIGEFAKFELIAFLEVEKFLEEEYPNMGEFDFYKIENREIAEINGKRLSADIYLFSAPPSFLLKVCKVPRFYGLPDRNVKLYYQRMLNKNKLKQMREKFIKNSKYKSYPTPITLVLPPTVKERKNKFLIPSKYGSLIIIDGQHRLYSYAFVSEGIQKRAKILVTGIKFHSRKIEDIQKFSARTFIDINREQTKVKTSLLYLIAYDSMGDTSNEALAGKVISLCNTDPNSPLHDLFEGRALGRKSKLGISRISVVEVTKKLAKLIKELREGNQRKIKNVSKLLKREELDLKPEELIDITKRLMDGYFKKVKEVFKDDWQENTKSLIFKTKYIAAFIILLNDFLLDATSFIQIKEYLERIKKNIKSNSKWKRSTRRIPINERNQIFHEKRDGTLPVKYSTEKIAKSLRHYMNYSTTFQV